MFASSTTARLKTRGERGNLELTEDIAKAEASAVPAPVRLCLDQAGLNHRPVWLAVDTDIALDGQPLRQWLVATSDHLSVVTDGERPTLLRYLAWEEIQSVRTVSGVGSGLLQVQLNGQWTDLLRYSNALAHRFHKVSRRLDAQAHGESPADPAVDDRAHFDPPRCPSCQLRLSTSEESCPRCLQKGQIMRRVWSLIRPYWRGSVMLCLLTLVGVVAELIPPKLQQYMVDQVLMSHDAKVGSTDMRTALLIVVLSLAASRILLSVVGVIKGHLATVIGSGLTTSLRMEMVQKLQNLAVAYYDRHQVGSMISRVAHDSEVLQGLMHQLTGGFLLQTVQLFGVGAMLVWLNPKLALFTLIPVPLVFVGSWFFWNKVYPRYYRLWDASSKQMAVLSGMLSGIRVVKAFAQEDREYQRFRRAADSLKEWRLWVEFASARYGATMQLVFSLGGLIVWYVGGRDVIGSEMTLGQLIAFLAYLSMFYAPLGALSNFTTWLTSFLSGSKRVLELLDTPITVMDPELPTAWEQPRGEIEFEHVTFGYDPNQPVLKDVSYRVKPGEMVGIVGRSGSGKTTMVNLLGRFYDVQEGRILIDGIDVRQLSVQQLRQHLGIVFQDSFLFRGTIWSNLSYGRPQTATEEGLAAAKAAGAHDFICRTQLGYETQLGEHGSGLSGGEKQRLSIARTLLYDPKILILDEATSNIDAEAEKSIQEALEVLIHGRTTVAIAHRLSTLRNADRILVFDRGRLVEQGSHAELLSQDGVYARLVRIQTQVSKDPNVDRLLHRMESGSEPGQLARAEGGTESSGAGTAVAAAEHPEAAPGSGGEGEPETAQQVAPTRAPLIHWLEPQRDIWSADSHGQLQLALEGGEPIPVFVVRTFGATMPERYLSVRRWNESGEDIELGLVRDLAEWPAEAQRLIRHSLARRYLLRTIQQVHACQLAHGFLELDVETDAGRQTFTMRWTGSQAIDFGDNGKLLIDTEDNRYIVTDVDRLPARDRERFLHYIYW